jgi:hypothetical protein
VSGLPLRSRLACLLGLPWKLPPETLTMPDPPWCVLPAGEQYAWYASLGRAIAMAGDGITTELRDRDGRAAARITPPR